MCGIAGIVDLEGGAEVPSGAAERMARAIIHRGPDEGGYFRRPGLVLASRRLSIVGLADGRQPVTNEDGSVAVVFNGELFDHVEQRVELAARGHHLAKHCDTEIIPHLWEESRTGMFEKLRGQFAIALWDERRRTLVLGRDRFGICPLYWSRQGRWLLFASEIKALLASGLVPAKPDWRGIDRIFTFAALPAPVTCFDGVQLLRPSHFLEIRPGGRTPFTDRCYWQMDFPDAGDEEMGADPKRLVDEFESVLLKAVGKRLRADVPVGAYLSGGVDSGTIVALAQHVRGAPISTYTVRVDAPGLDELGAAQRIAAHLGTTPPVVQEFRPGDALGGYPELIAAAECPVIDTSCAALLQLARRVRLSGQKVVLTGEGADEWLVGYPWYKIERILRWLDMVPGLRLDDWAKRAWLRARRVPQFPREYRRHIESVVGGPNAWIDSFGLLSLAKLRFYNERMRHVMTATDPWGDLEMPLERAKRWHPLNRGIWMAGRVVLGGHLLQAKGDRVSMHSSVEVRYPFLDEDVFTFTSRLHPKWKLRGFRDKHLLRLLAERWLPPFVYRRQKVIFRAPLDSFHLDPGPKFVEQLLSEESLKRTDCFDAAAVHRWRREYRQMRSGSLPRLSLELGLAAVVATQLWHHLFVDASLCELPAAAARAPQSHLAGGQPAGHIPGG